MLCVHLHCLKLGALLGAERRGVVFIGAGVLLAPLIILLHDINLHVLHLLIVHHLAINRLLLVLRLQMADALQALRLFANAAHSAVAGGATAAPLPQQQVMHDLRIEKVRLAFATLAI